MGTQNTKSFKLEIGGRELTVEIKNLAEQANGDVLVRYGDTLVLSTCVMSPDKKEGIDFFPLTVDYEERYYAAGKIRGPRYIKREGRPSDEAICNARLIDRTIRPRFPQNLSREVQVVNTVLSWDGENDPDILAIIATSLSLSISDIPWLGPLAAIRIGRKDGQFILNPSYADREKSDMDLILSAGFDSKGELLVNMIEGSFDESEESLVLEALEFSREALGKICDFQKQIQSQKGKDKISIGEPPKDLLLEQEIKTFLGKRIEEAIYQKEKTTRFADINQLKGEVSIFVEGKYPGLNKSRYGMSFLEKEVERIIHENIILQGKRPDGRKIDEIRQLSIEAGILPRTHGSGLFCRGQTKSLSILTLGAPGDQQLVEGMEIVGKKRFMHHYNFPPYSVGEIRPMRGPGRRDIGHGMLAEKALLPLIPPAEQFPYTIRIVSEILSSNGSTSMASVSSSSLALMDAGVPIKAPAAGIALGLMQDQNGKYSVGDDISGKARYKILADIQGPEDHHGDMDFKVAGTNEGITAIQMDVKISGITSEILKETLFQGKKIRLGILEEMKKILPAPRPQLSPYAPRILTLQINPEKIREVIGPGGKIINEITRETGVTIDIQDSGLIFITSEKEETAEKALAWIKNITREVKVGEIFQGKVKRILDFGAFVEILPNQEGLVHISELAPYRVERVEDVVKIGDIVPVKVISIDEQGRINLSLKQLRPERPR